MLGIIIKVVGGKVVFQPDRPEAQPGNPLEVIQGDLVTWNNRTDDFHHPVAISPPGLFLTDDIPPNQASDPLFNVTQSPGTTITYMCSRHPDDLNEKGSIKVVDE